MLINFEICPSDYKKYTLYYNYTGKIAKIVLHTCTAYGPWKQLQNNI